MSDPEWRDLSEEDRDRAINLIGTSLKMAARDRDDDGLSPKMRETRRRDADALHAALGVLIDEAFTGTQPSRPPSSNATTPDIAMLREALNRDRTGLAAALDAVRSRARGSKWITEGRGSYTYDDARYREETGYLIRDILAIVEKGLNESGALAMSVLRDGVLPPAAQVTAAPTERADDSIRRRQKFQPWSVPYSQAFDQASAIVAHLPGSHNALHLMKSAGKIAAALEAGDHGKDIDRRAIADASADLLSEALRFANLYGFDLADEHTRRVVEKNGVASTDAPPEPPQAPTEGPGWFLRGGHRYVSSAGSSLHDCAHGCGAWMANYTSGGPDGVDPQGDCPKAPPEPSGSAGEATPVCKPWCGDNAPPFAPGKWHWSGDPRGWCSPTCRDGRTCANPAPKGTP